LRAQIEGLQEDNAQLQRELDDEREARAEAEAERDALLARVEELETGLAEGEEERIDAALDAAGVPAPEAEGPAPAVEERALEEEGPPVEEPAAEEVQDYREQVIDVAQRLADFADGSAASDRTGMVEIQNIARELGIEHDFVSREIGSTEFVTSGTSNDVINRGAGAMRELDADGDGIVNLEEARAAVTTVMDALQGSDIVPDPDGEATIQDQGQLSPNIQETAEQAERDARGV